MQRKPKSATITGKCLEKECGEKEMFGYIRICEPELKVKDLRKYKACYCGLCRALKEQYGAAGQMTLTYDMTFVALLLTSLYEPEGRDEMHRCKVHPLKKQRMYLTDMTEYAADMNILMSYYHLKDDWEDERKASALLGAGVFRKKAEKIAARYPRQSRVFAEELGRLAQLERQKSLDLDGTAGCFGRMMAEMLVFREDVWQEPLRKLGFFLGKFVYLMDAYEDLEEDLKKGRYNPLRELAQSTDYEERAAEILCMMMGEASAWFERLPCLLDVDILRNILYDGVWVRYRAIQEKRKEKENIQDKENKERTS